MTRRFREYTRGRWLAEFGTGVGVVALRDQDVVQVGHGSSPALVAVGEANRTTAFFLSQFLRRHRGARRRRKLPGVLVPAPRLGLANVVVLFGGRVIGMRSWNVVPLTTSHSDCAGCHLIM